MTSLDRVPGVGSELAAFLNAVGISSAEDLSLADEISLQRDLERLARKRGRGSLVPSVVTVKIWVKTARELVGRSEPKVEIDLSDIPEAIDLDSIPEAELDPSELTLSEEASLPRPISNHRPRANRQDDFSTRAFGKNSHVPAKREDAPQNPDLWKTLDKSRFQTLSDYNGARRGIEPLKRASSPTTDSKDKVVFNSSGRLSRRTRRGVLYPHPWKAIAGAAISLAWRVCFAASCILLPWYIYVNSTVDHRPILEMAIWCGGLVLLGCLQLWAIASVRCRICSCHLFHSKRCFKNSKAHRIPGFGHVASLSLHLLLFQWFRCMYCGTAIRLFSGRAAPQSDDEEE